MQTSSHLVSKKSSWLVQISLARIFAIVDSPDTDLLQHCAEQLADDCLPQGWDRVASSTFSRVAYNAELGLYYKEFLPRSPIETAKGWLRGTRAARARKANDALRFAGFGSPQTIYHGKLEGGREFDYSQSVPGECIEIWLRKTVRKTAHNPQPNGKPEITQLRRELLSTLGVAVGRLHASGFIHGDLRPGNVVAQHTHGRFQLSFLDNERTVRRHSPSGKMLLRNIMQLNMLPHSLLSKADRMRFFTAWRRQMRELSPVEAKIVAAEGYRWAMRRLEEKI